MPNKNTNSSWVIEEPSFTPLRTILQWLAGIIIIIFAVTWLGFRANEQRSLRIIAKETKAVEQLQKDNPGKIESILTDTMERCHAEYLAQLEKTKNSVNPYPYSVGDAILCTAGKTALDGLQKDRYPNFPSTSFLRYQPGKLQLIEASGNYRVANNLSDAYFLSWEFQQQSSLNNIASLTEEIRPSRWQDFLNYIPGKEVFIPVRKDGIVIGIIFHGVVEKGL